MAYQERQYALPQYLQALHESWGYTLFIAIRNALAFALVVLNLSACDMPYQDPATLKIVTRNGPTTYYEGRHGPEGFEYALIKAFAEEYNYKFEVSVEHSLEGLFNALDTGKADIAAGGLTKTKQRAENYSAMAGYLKVTELLLFRYGTKQPHNLADLENRSIAVLANSAHESSLEKLKLEHPHLQWQRIEHSDTLDLLERMNTGEIDLMIADSLDYEVNKPFYAKVGVAFTLTPPRPLAWFTAKDTNPELQSQIADFLSNVSKDGRLNALHELYYGHISHMSRIGSRTFYGTVQSRLPKYEALIKRIARQEGIDWTLLAAISYQESYWLPKAVSPTGVRGMMMLTKVTAKEMGVTDRTDPEQSLRGGARYFKKVLKRIPQDIPNPDRTWFALASYNVGYGHLEDARVLTQRQGGDPDAWLDVMQRLPLLRKPKYYKTLRHGYARGNEPVNYVQRIRHYTSILKIHQAETLKSDPPLDVTRHLPPALTSQRFLIGL